MNIDAILFDKDGTLIDFDAFWVPTSVQALKFLLNKLNRADISVEHFLERIGVKDERTEITSLLRSGTYAQISEEIATILNAFDCVEVIKDILLDGYSMNMDAGIIKPLSETTIPTLTELKRRGKMLGIVTTDDPIITEKCLLSLKIKGLFDRIHTDDGKIRPKPYPDALYDFLSVSHITAGKTVMIGDTLTDALFAENAGIRFIGIARSEEARFILSEKSEYIISDISELLNIIK